MARADKVAAVAEMTERFQSSSGAVLTEYRGLSVAQLGELRRSLGEHATFAVVKNTLTKIAASDAGVAAELTELLSGPSAIAFVQGDVVEAAKGLRDFSRANPFLVIKGGVLDGKVMTPDEIVKLADLEPREVLLAKLAGRHEGVDGRRGGHVRGAAGPDGQAARGAGGEAGRRGPRRRRRHEPRRGAGARGRRAARRPRAARRAGTADGGRRTADRVAAVHRDSQSTGLRVTRVTCTT